jgi:hypothetical protein
MLPHQHPTLSVQAIIADNALDNAVVRGLVRSNRAYYATRWTTGLACAVHLRNLQVESQFNVGIYSTQHFSLNLLLYFALEVS